MDKRLPFTFAFHNNGDMIYGHAILPGVGPPGLKFGGHNNNNDPEVKDTDKVGEISKAEIETFSKKTVKLVPASKGKVIHH